MCSKSQVGATSANSTPRMTHRLPDTFEPTERANGGQHVRRIRALLAAGFDPATFATVLQEHIEQTAFCSLGEQATSKFTEHRAIKPGIGSFQA